MYPPIIQLVWKTRLLTLDFYFGALFFLFFVSFLLILLVGRDK